MSKSSGADEYIVDWRDFLVSHPPGTTAIVENVALYAVNPPHFHVKTPELALFCNAAYMKVTHCVGGLTQPGFYFGTFKDASKNPASDGILLYHCEKCGTFLKSYSIRFWNIGTTDKRAEYSKVTKIAEHPRFSPQIPNDVTKLIGQNRDLFSQGSPCRIRRTWYRCFLLLPQSSRTAEEPTSR